MLPAQGTSTIFRPCGREYPMQAARSPAPSADRLQQKAVMDGLKSLSRVFFPVRNFVGNCPASRRVDLNGKSRALSRADTTALAGLRVNRNLWIQGYCAIRADAQTGQAADTVPGEVDFSLSGLLSGGFL